MTKDAIISKVDSVIGGTILHSIGPDTVQLASKLGIEIGICGRFPTIISVCRVQVVNLTRHRCIYVAYVQATEGFGLTLTR